MNRSNYPTIGLLIIAFVVSMLFTTESVRADFTFGERVNIKAVVPVLNATEFYFADCLSYDGLETYFTCTTGGIDLYVARRASKDEDWGSPESLGPSINTPKEESLASISSDGLTLYFSSDRSGGYGDFDLYMTTRATKDAPWGQVVNLGPNINYSGGDGGPTISSDGLELYFESRRPGGQGQGDLWVTRRTSTNEPWETPTNLGPIVNSPYDEEHPFLSPDGLLLFFDDHFKGHNRPGGYGIEDMWVSRRASLSSPWEAPVNLGPKVNGAAYDFEPRISPDGHTLFFGTALSLDTSTCVCWQAPIIPIVDFNNDGIVDIADVGVMVENWYTSNPLCDIGPMPWGDGIVDDKDLRVLTEHLSTATRPIANWKLDEEDGRIAYDSAGNYDADLHSSPHWQPSGGVKGGALQLDGTDEYVSTPFILNPAECSFSIFAWIKSSTRGQVIIAQNDTTGTRWLWADPSYGRLTSWLMHPPFKPLMSPSTVTDGQWHQVGLVYDFEGLRRYLYVDGVEVDRDTEAAGGVGSNGSLYFGAEKTLGAGTFFSGLIDDVRVYRDALTEDEVAALAQ